MEAVRNEWSAGVEEGDFIIWKHGSSVQRFRLSVYSGSRDTSERFSKKSEHLLFLDLFAELAPPIFLVIPNRFLKIG